jgi:AcrR family transcriptional regulator
MAKRRNTRQAIIENAVTLLSEQGFEGFTAAALAETVGVSKANLFHHFSSIEEIVFEAFGQFSMRLKMSPLPPEITFREWLEGIGQDAFRLGEMSDDIARVYIAFMARALFDEKLQQRVLSAVQSANKASTDTVMALYPGKLSHKEVKALGALIFTTADGMAIHLHAFPERREDLQAAWRMFVSWVATKRDETQVHR